MASPMPTTSSLIHFPTFTSAPMSLEVTGGIVNRAGEEVRPVPLEERHAGAVASTDWRTLTDEPVGFVTHDDLLGAVVGALGQEADLLEWASARLWRPVSIRGADGARPPAASATVKVEGKRLERRLGHNGHLSPLQRPRGLIGPLESNSLPADFLVQRPRRSEGFRDVLRTAEDPCVVVHPVLHFLSHRLDGERAVGAKQVENPVDPDLAYRRRKRDRREGWKNAFLGRKSLFWAIVVQLRLKMDRQNIGAHEGTNAAIEQSDGDGTENRASIAI
jgi:hypothetical protein